MFFNNKLTTKYPFNLNNFHIFNIITEELTIIYE